ncbi:MAG: zinc-dependent alcohol dehydrogenase [Actinomycetota bacterium]
MLLSRRQMSVERGPAGGRVGIEVDAVGADVVDVIEEGVALRAMVLEGPERIELRRMEAPPLAPDHTLIDVRAVGICGTDLSIFHGAIPVSYPRILGHEIVGEVAESGGSGDGGMLAGTRVVVNPSVSCRSCARCREGRENLCDRGWLLGRDRDGGLQETVSVPSANLHVVPQGVSDHAAPSIQVLSTCLHGQAMVDLLPGGSVAVIGLGVTGLMHVQLAASKGASPIVGVTRSADKLALALEMGATHAVPADDPRADDIVREITGGGVDVVIECAGTVGTLARAVRVARPGGRILAYGTITEDRGPFPYYQLYYKELALVSPRAATDDDVVASIEAAAAGAVDLERLVTDRVPLERAGEAMARSGSGTLKIVVEV